MEKRGNKFRVRKTIDGKTYTLVFDKKPTKTELALALAEAMREPPKIARTDTFEIYAKKYTDVKKNVLSVSTVRSYNGMLKHIPEWFKDIPIKQIKADDMQRLVNEYSVGRSAKSTKNMASFVSSVFTMFRPNFSATPTLPAKQHYDYYIPTNSEVKRILDDVAGTQWEVPLRLACYGMRRGEICALKATDVKGCEVTINKAVAQNEQDKFELKGTKTYDSTRTIFIDEELAELIQQQGYVCRCYPNSINRELQRRQQKLGIPKFRLHDLRHFFCTELSGKISEADLMYLGGWSSNYTMNSVYRHNRAERDKEKRLEAQRIIGELLT